MNAIQEACLQILHSGGAEQLSTQNIADVAGVNIASV
ncbi:MAG: AcrR family transcriptional regulator, partial [Cryomorphaceae bacterium]